MTTVTVDTPAPAVIARKLMLLDYVLTVPEGDWYATEEDKVALFNGDALVLYARFIGDTVDYVLNQVIDTTIAKDREFVTWRAEQPATAPAEPAANPNGRTHAGPARTRAEATR